MVTVKGADRAAISIDRLQRKYGAQQVLLAYREGIVTANREITPKRSGDLQASLRVSIVSGVMTLYWAIPYAGRIIPRVLDRLLARAGHLFRRRLK